MNMKQLFRPPSLPRVSIEFASVSAPGEELKYAGRPGIEELAAFPEYAARFVPAWLRTTDPEQKCTLFHRSPATAAYALSALGVYLDPVPLNRIYHDCPEMVRMRNEHTGAAGTLNRRIAVLRRVLKLAARKWRNGLGEPYLATVPLLPHVRGKKRQRHIVTLDEQQRLLAELPEHLTDAMVFAINTGLRAGEQRNLRWEWETSDGGFRLLPEVTKTLRARYVPCNKAARACVDRQRGKNPDYVWTYEGNPITDKLNNHAFRKARKRAGLSHVRWHDFRHTFATRARATGAPLTDVAALLGHAIPGLEMTDHYSEASVKALQKVVRGVAQPG